MRHFRDAATGKVYGVDVGQDHLIQPAWVEMTAEEFEAHRSTPIPEAEAIETDDYWSHVAESALQDSED